jgi:hypothetical protein
MQKPKTFGPEPESQETAQLEHNDVALLVEHIFDLLGKHQADPTDGVLSLLTAFMQGSDRVLTLSTPEETESNRAALLSMLDHARAHLAEWPQHTPETWQVH